MLRDAWMVCRKDLLVEWRSKVTTRFVGPFVLSVVMLFAFAFDAESLLLERAAGGLFWITVLFASTTISLRSAAIERVDGLPDAMRMSNLSPAGIFLGKTLATFLQLTALEVVLAAAMTLMYAMDWRGVGLILASVPLATACIAAVGALYGALAAGLSGRESVLQLLTLPALAPVLLAATKCFGVAFGTAVGSGWRWLGLLGMLMGIYLAAGMATSAAVLEDT